jgi:transposase
MLRIDFTEEDIKKLHYERYHYPHPLVQRKMEVIYLKSQGLAHQDIRMLCQISKTTLTKYIRQYKKGGVEELKKLEYKGQISELNQYGGQIEEYFKKHPASSVAEASDAIEKITGIKRSPTQIREFMKRIGLRCLKVGYVPGKSMETIRIAEVAIYRKEKLEPLLQEAINGEKAVFFVDAAHFVHRAYLGFLWCFTRTFICSPSGRRRFNVLGAVNAVTKEIITVTNVLILDNARYQKCKLVDEYAKALKIELCYLPAYSPQLNLIERLWKFVRNECLYSKYYEDFADFKLAISNCIGTANTERKEKLDSLLTLNFQSFSKVHILTV